MSKFATKITDGLFTAPLSGIRLPQRDYLVGEYILGGTEAETLKNRANPSLPMTVQGTGHVYNANSVVIRPHATLGYGYLTGVLPHEHATLIVVRKNGTAATTTHIVGFINTGSLWGARQHGTNNYMSMMEPNPTGGAPRPKPGAGTIYFEAGVQSVLNAQTGVGGKTSLYYYSAGVQQVALAPTAGVLIGTRRLMTVPVAIGTTSLTDSGSSTVEVYYVALYNRPLTPAEIEAAYQAIVAWYATRGVTVV
jgi:hypothetical protein